MFRPILNHLNFRLSRTLLPALLFLILLPLYPFIPEAWAYENGLIESLQLIVLLFGIVLCLTTPTEKGLYRSIALILSILILREINCGRTLFFAVPGAVNQFRQWKNIPYGWLAHPLFGLYIVGSLLTFLKQKRYLTLWRLIQRIRLPFWTLLLMIIGVTFTLLGERVMEEARLEEIAEMLFYLSMTSGLYLYSRQKLPPAAAFASPLTPSRQS